jgi:xylulokinase
MTLVLGIDLGLSGARAAVVDQNGALVARGLARLAGKNLHEASPRDWQRVVVEAVREAMHSLGRRSIEAIGIGALGPCPVVLDAHLEPLLDAPLFSIDSGAEGERKELLRRHGLAEYELGPDHVLPRLALWQRTRPETIERARVVVDATGYLVAWLTGRLVIDPATRHDHAAAGLPQPVPLPEMQPATSLAGRLTDDAAKLLSLPSGTPVTVGSYDSYVDLFGAGVRRDGEAGLLLGSTMVLGMVRADAPDSAALAAHGLSVTPYIGDLAVVGGWTSSSGSVLDWAEKLAPAAQTGLPLPLPGSHGLLALPYFAGERAPVWDPLARGAFVGPTLGTQVADLHRALREAVALSTLDIGDRLASALGPVERYRAAGGGLRNAVWAQDTADALGVPLDVVAHAGEAMGPAMLALAAIGREVTPRIEKTITPDARRHARYRELLSHYRRLYPALKDTLHALGRMAGKEAT